jgi:hydroxyethylthiazole kinase-like uncharacterized protein yjeF
MEELHYYTAAATRELDRLAIEEYNIPGYELMQRAANAAFTALLKNWPNVKNIIVLCGTGNNGGDGFIIAGLAKKYGLKVDIYVAGDVSRISGDAKTALDYALSSELDIITASDHKYVIKNQINNSNNKTGEIVIVDALLGTGLTGKVRDPFTDLIKNINDSSLPVLAVDIPSGLCSDSGEILGNAVKADLTITYIARKIGLITNTGPEFTGKLLFDDLNVPDDIYTKVSFVK